MKDYYLAQDKGTVIGVKITSNDGKDTKSKKNTDNQNSVDDDIINSITEDILNSPNKEKESLEVPDNGDSGLIEYEVQSGDTIESIVSKFKTNEEKIKELNNGKTVFTVGQTIYVPGR